MSTPKFDNHDRKRVVSEIERYFNVTLQKTGSRDILLEDETGRSFWVIGGTGDYHGIPKEMFTAEEKQAIEGVLVIAKRKLTSIDIYAGNLPPLIRSKGLLTVTDTQYQFDVISRNDTLKLKQAPDVRLKKMSTIPYSQEGKISDKTNHEMSRLIDKMPEEMKKAVFQKLMQTVII